MRNRLTYCLSIITVILLGLASRHFSEFLPGWINLYLGDILWAVMIFLMAGFLFRRKSTLWVAAAAILFSYFIEISQIYHAPWIDSLRRTRIGGLTLGFGFLWSDLVSYTAGVVIGVLLERKLLLMPKKLLCQQHPLLYFLSVWEKRLRRYFKWYFCPTKYAKYRSTEKLPCRVKKHQSVLIRKLGDSDLQLQYNKVTNLKIALGQISGITIKPGETFSFCKLVGLPTKGKGYLPGMELCRGEAGAGIGGGICQIANLIHWLVMHSPLTVTERHHHSFDPFPDDRRVLPFGSGATVFYNYIDYQFINNTPYTFQINLWLSEKCLEGELCASQKLPYTYHVFEQNHEFLKIGEEYYRRNEIWRNKLIRGKSGEIIETELLTKNFAKVKYIPEEYNEDKLT